MKIIWHILVCSIVGLVTTEAQNYLVNCLYDIIDRLSPLSVVIITSSRFQRNNSSYESLCNSISSCLAEDKSLMDLLLQKFQKASRWPVLLLQVDEQDKQIYYNNNIMKKLINI